MSAHFSDHFSGHANEYASARPTYPQALFNYLTDLCTERNCAWDCATGSGQAAIALSRTFRNVIATDASSQQIEHATPAANVAYHVALAEASNIASGSIDLVTVAQAIHWFDFDRFHREVRRVAKSNAVIAAWSYGLTRISPEIDAIVLEFYNGPIAPYWPAERSHVETEYRDIPFPYQEHSPPGFEMRVEWNAGALLAYLCTWSSVKRYEAALGCDPVVEISDSLCKAWGTEIRVVRWPLILKVGRANIS